MLAAIYRSLIATKALHIPQPDNYSVKASDDAAEWRNGRFDSVSVVLVSICSSSFLARPPRRRRRRPRRRGRSRGTGASITACTYRLPSVVAGLQRGRRWKVRPGCGGAPANGTGDRAYVRRVPPTVRPRVREVRCRFVFFHSCRDKDVRSKSGHCLTYWDPWFILYLFYVRPGLH